MAGRADWKGFAAAVCNRLYQAACIVGDNIFDVVAPVMVPAVPALSY
jgi:hypothetical protein